MSYQIGPWIYSPDKCLLTDGNTEVELEPLLVRLLTVFIANPDKIVTRAELIAEAWQQAFVDDNAINRAISELRRQMAHPLSKSGIIKTHYRKGYSLAVPVKAVVQITDSNNQVSTDQQTPVAHSAKKSNGLAIAIGFILFAIACTLAYLITTQKQQETKDMVITRTAELTAATWLLGKETSPQVSPDKAYLAFYNVHKGQTKSFVKRLSDNASSQVSHLDYRVSVFSWQPKSEILLAELVNKERGECFYGTFSTEQFPAVRFERFIKACNKEAIGMAQMSRDGSLLYYIDKDAAEIGYEVRQFSIDSKRDKILLPSYEVTYGIRLFALSPDGQKILYRREEQGERLKFFTYDLKTHENILVHEFDWQGRGGAFSWHASNSKGLFREQDRLVSVDFDTKQRFMLKLSPNPMLASFSVLTPNQLFYSEFGGEKYILKRWQAPFEPDANRNQVILESDGSNYYPNLHDNKVAFVSNRGRSRQYWLSQNDSVIQISDFSNEQVNVLGPPSLSNSGELVLYRRDDSLEILDIKTRAIRQLTDIPGKFVNSAVFGKGDTKLYYSLTTEQIIQIWEYDLITQQTKQLTKDSAYHVVKDGLGNAYYIREQELIGLTNPDFRLTLPNHFNRCFCAISLSDNYIYTTDRNDYMYRTSLRDGTSEQFKLVEPIVGLQVTNDDESVILTVKKAADTQIKRLSW